MEDKVLYKRNGQDSRIFSRPVDASDGSIGDWDIQSLQCCYQLDPGARAILDSVRIRLNVVDLVREIHRYFHPDASGFFDILSWMSRSVNISVFYLPVMPKNVRCFLRRVDSSQGGIIPYVWEFCLPDKALEPEWNVMMSILMGSLFLDGSSKHYYDISSPREGSDIMGCCMDSGALDFALSLMMNRDSVMSLWEGGLRPIEDFAARFHVTPLFAFRRLKNLYRSGSIMPVLGEELDFNRLDYDKEK